MFVYNRQKNTLVYDIKTYKFRQYTVGVESIQDMNNKDTKHRAMQVYLVGRVHSDWQQNCARADSQRRQRVPAATTCSVRLLC